MTDHKKALPREPTEAFEPSQDEVDAYRELRRIVARLRAPDGCPWDREQTHESLKPYLVQEAYEVLAVLDEGEVGRLPEELGDLLFQVLIHTQLGEEAGEFAMADVISGLAAKLVRRHPHVFGEGKLADAAQVAEQWDRLKAAERAEAESALSGIPRSLPALAYAQELLRRAGAAGFEWPDRRDVLVKVAEELREMEEAQDQRRRAEEFGDLLLNLANWARYSGIDAEEALRIAATKFRRRFEEVERMARAERRPLADTDVAGLLQLWSRAKQSEG
jgi:tetrapyrrole methylase family protein/MazG family protein